MPGDNSDLSWLGLRIVYEDLPDLVEIEARVVAGDWSGVTTAYTSPTSLGEQAHALRAWTKPLRGEFLIQGVDTGIGRLSLRWSPVDSAGHLACQVRFASRSENDRPEGVRRLSLELLTEPGLVERFARELAALALSLGSEATMIGV